MQSIFTNEQVEQLEAVLDPRLITTREGANRKVLSYIEGHDAIDQANRIFGYGNWGYRTLSCDSQILVDPVTQAAIGVLYQAHVEISVRDAVTISDVGSSSVFRWNLSDQIMTKRRNAARYARSTARSLEEFPATDEERMQAQAIITESHDMARKGAITDALKRALRCYGNQFGNSLYGETKPEQETGESEQPGRSPGQRVPQNQVRSGEVPELHEVLDAYEALNAEWCAKVRNWHYTIQRKMLNTQELPAHASPEEVQQARVWLEEFRKSLVIA